MNGSFKMSFPLPTLKRTFLKNLLFAGFYNFENPRECIFMCTIISSQPDKVADCCCEEIEHKNMTNP